MVDRGGKEVGEYGGGKVMVPREEIGHVVILSGKPLCVYTGGGFLVYLG